MYCCHGRRRGVTCFRKSDNTRVVIIYYIEDITRVVISYEIYQTSLRRV